MYALSKIGRYEIKGRIGGGGMGTLYLARDSNPTTDRLVAIKLLRASFDSDELRQRFAREAQALAELNHPNIVVIYDSGEFEDSPFIVMEYVRGETLAESIKRRAPLPLGQKLRLLSGLCAGLAHAHEAGIIHRDIKPANLMVDVHGRLKILDFGIARLTDPGTTRVELTRLNVQVGTPGYMSPEQIEGVNIDVRSDLFSVGAVAYELISYREAFPGATTRQIENKVLTEAPVPLASSIPDLDPEIARIIDTALEKDVEHRCQHAATLGRAFDRIRARLHVEDSGITPPTPTPKPGAERKSRHERAAQTAYERAVASQRQGAEGPARRSAMEALAEYPQHAEARQLLIALGHFRDVEPWLPPLVVPATPPPAARLDDSVPTGTSRPAVAEPTELWKGTPADQPTAARKKQTPPPLDAPAEPWQGTSAAANAPEPPKKETLPPPDALTELWQGTESRGEAAPPKAEAAVPPEPPPTELWRGTPPTGKRARPLKDDDTTPLDVPTPLWQQSGKPSAQAPVSAGASLAGPPPPVAERPSAGTSAAKARPQMTRRASPGWQRPTLKRSTAAVVAVSLAGIVLVGAAATWLFWLRAMPTERLTIRKPSGGTIIGDGIQCGTNGTDCTVTPRRGTVVALQAHADEGFVFKAFTGDCASTGGTVMTAARTCSAVFEKIEATQTVGASGEQLLSIDMPTGGTIEGAGIRCGALGSECSAKQAAGTQVALVATPSSGYVFGAFTGDCIPGGTTTMDAARRCGATFTPAGQAPAAEYLLTVATPVGGTILGEGIKCGVLGTSCASRHPHGSAVSLRYQAADGYRFAGFTGACKPSGKTVMTAERTCGAMFVKEDARTPAPPVLLSITPARNGTILGNGINCGTGGSQCSAAQTSGAVIALRAHPDPGFRFAGFTGDCDAAGSVVMTVVRNCSATFVKEGAAVGAGAVSFILTITPPRDGTITVDGLNLNCGSQGSSCVVARPREASVQLRAHPNPGFRLVSFTGDCDVSGATVMTAARTCSATFARDNQPIVRLFDTIRVGSTQEVVALAKQAVQIKAPAGWQQIVWQSSADYGRSWADLSEGENYSGVRSETLTIRRPSLEMNGRQYRVRQTVGRQQATSGPATLIVKATVSPAVK